MPRFVILEHDHPALHWDLMLEAKGALRTWRLPLPPMDGDLVAEALGDHRLAYLDYQGPVSGNRGNVERWDFGTWQADSLSDDAIDATIVGTRIQGRLALRRRDGPFWRLTFTLSAGVKSTEPRG